MTSTVNGVVNGDNDGECDWCETGDGGAESRVTTCPTDGVGMFDGDGTLNTRGDMTRISDGLRVTDGTEVGVIEDGLRESAGEPFDVPGDVIGAGV